MSPCATQNQALWPVPNSSSSSGEVIPQIVEGYGFDDVDGQEVPGQNEASDFPIETATANTVVSGTYSGGQIAMKIVKQAEFDYFMGLVLPHAVTFTINVTYSTASGNVTTDATFSGTLISAVETNDGAVVNPVSWYTFTMNQLEGPQDIPANATINTTKFVLNDNEALVVGPFFSPVESTQLWLHTQSSLGGKKETNWKVVIWKIDDDYNRCRERSRRLRTGRRRRTSRRARCFIALTRSLRPAGSGNTRSASSARITPVMRHCSRSKRSTALTSVRMSSTRPIRWCE